MTGIVGGGAEFTTAQNGGNMATIPSQIFDGYSVHETVYHKLPSSFSFSFPGGVEKNGNHNGSDVYWCGIVGDLGVNNPTIIYASSTSGVTVQTPQGGSSYMTNHYLNGIYTHDDRKVYYASNTEYVVAIDGHNIATDNTYSGYINAGIIAWLMLYGDNIPDGYGVTYDLQDCTGSNTNPTVILINAATTHFDFTPDTDYSFVFNSVYIDGDGFPSGTPIIYDWDPDTGHLKVGPVTSNIVVHVHAYIDPYADLPIDGETDIPDSDVIPVPSLPGLGAVSAGVIGLFAPSPSQMQALANYMWTDFGGSGTTVEDILGEIVEALKRLIANPLDYVVGLNIIPSQGLSIGSDRTIRFGFVNSGVSMPQLTSQYFVVDCGTLSFSTLCGDTFLDYAPYSKFSIYLPYIGIKDVDANDFIGHTIGVVYHGDVVTGGITAYITKDGSVMYQYSGCCALNVPLSSDSWGETISGAVQIATSLIGGGFAGGAAGVAESAVKGAASVAANPSLLSPKVAHSGAVSGGAGCMGVQTPFVIREAVRFHTTVGMNTVSGYPSYYYKSLGSVSGYTVVLDVHLKGIPATSDEISEIETLLKTGVVL